MKRVGNCGALAITLFFAAAASAKKDKLLVVASYQEPQQGIKFDYPKEWSNITIADDSSKVEAKTADGESRLTIEGLLKPPEGGVVGVLQKRLPGGSVSGSGEWHCIEGDIEGGKRRAAVCGRRVKGAEEEILLVGVSVAQARYAKLGGKALALKLGAAATGIKAAHEE